MIQLSIEAPVKPGEIKFEVVPNDIRDNIKLPPRPGEKSELFLKLLADETVFVRITDDLNETALNKLYEKARGVGKRLRKNKSVYNDEIGYVMWFDIPEKKEAE